MPFDPSRAWTDGCPSPQLLAAYSLGKLSSAEVESVASHLAVCGGCEALLDDAAERSDTLIQNLRRYLPGRRPPSEGGCGEGSHAPVTVADANPLTDTAATVLPPRVGQYELLDKLGQGGMGAVYKARQAGLNRLVAVKLALSAPLLGGEAYARFRIESEAIARLQHDHIVRVYECGEHDGRPYFSMEYVEGESLAQKLARGPLAEEEAAALVRTLARAVHFAHQHQIVHRDLKPANVLLGTNGAVKLTDFGLAKLLDAEEGLTQSEAVMGTASYMAPEQARGDGREVGPRTDVYGLGAILYEALTGRPPFKGATRGETLDQVRAQDPPPPSGLRQGLSRRLEAICLKCLAKTPAARYATAEALAEDLGSWLAGKPTVARPRRWTTRAWLALRRRTSVGGAAALALAAVAVVAVRWPATQPPPPNTPSNPFAAIEAIERDLAGGRPAVLIGETEGPRWSRSRMPTDPGEEVTGPDGAFSVSSSGLTFVELVRDPQSDSYRFSALVKHQDSSTPGGVGLYVAHRVDPGGPRTGVHQYLRLEFNDRSPPRTVRLPDGQVARLNSPPVRFHPEFYAAEVSQVHVAGVHNRLWYKALSGFSRSVRTPAGLNKTTWRKLAVEVTPTEVRAFWEGGPLGSLPVRKVTADTQAYLTKLGARTPGHPFLGRVRATLATRGGLGLYVYRGTAAFRSVVLQPIPKD